MQSEAMFQEQAGNPSPMSTSSQPEHNGHICRRGVEGAPHKEQQSSGFPSSTPLRRCRSSSANGFKPYTGNGVNQLNRP